LFRTFIIAVLAFAVAAAATYAAVLFGTLAVWEMMGVRDRDGGGTMALGLVIGPVAAVFGGVIAAAIAAVVAERRRRNGPPSSVEDKRRDKYRLIAAGGAIAGAFAGHYLASFGFWLASPIRFDSYWKVWALSWLPTLLTAAGAIAGALTARALLRR
jgi:hypothetical protein